MLVSYANANFCTPTGTSDKFASWISSVFYLLSKRTIMHIETAFL